MGNQIRCKARITAKGKGPVPGTRYKAREKRPGPWVTGLSQTEVCSGLRFEERWRKVRPSGTTGLCSALDSLQSIFTIHFLRRGVVVGAIELPLPVTLGTFLRN